MPAGANGSGMFVPIGDAIAHEARCLFGLVRGRARWFARLHSTCARTFLGSESFCLLVQRLCASVPGLLRFPVKLGRNCMTRENSGSEWRGDATLDGANWKTGCDRNQWRWRSFCPDASRSISRLIHVATASRALQPFGQARPSHSFTLADPSRVLSTNLTTMPTEPNSCSGTT